MGDFNFTKGQTIRFTIPNSVSYGVPDEYNGGEDTVYEKWDEDLGVFIVQKSFGEDVVRAILLQKMTQSQGYGWGIVFSELVRLGYIAERVKITTHRLGQLPLARADIEQMTAHDKMCVLSALSN